MDQKLIRRGSRSENRPKVKLDPKKYYRLRKAKPKSFKPRGNSISDSSQIDESQNIENNEENIEDFEQIPDFQSQSDDFDLTNEDNDQSKEDEIDKNEEDLSPKIEDDLILKKSTLEVPPLDWNTKMFNKEEKDFSNEPTAEEIVKFDESFDLTNKSTEFYKKINENEIRALENEVIVQEAR